MGGLTIFSALYRIEAAAWYRQLLSWFLKDLDVDLFGGLPGREPSEASWDAQADIEHALMLGNRMVFMSLDFSKYFDCFDLRFT